MAGTQGIDAQVWVIYQPPGTVEEGICAAQVFISDEWTPQTMRKFVGDLKRRYRETG